MNRILSKMWRSFMAVLLVFCLMLGLCGNALVVLAADVTTDPIGSTSADQMINYVSIGDSMTNGYGFIGYNQDGHMGGYDEYDFFEDINVYGEGSYALQFESYLEGKGFDVNHTKLALSGLRAEDVAFLLDVAGEPVDGYFATCWSYAWWGDHDFVPGTSLGRGSYNYNKNNPEHADDIAAQLVQMKEYYQESMKNADIISLALGNASFNAYFIDCLMRVLGAMGEGWDPIDRPEVTLEDALAMMEDEAGKQMVLQTYDALMAKLLAVIPAEMLEQFKVDELCDLVAYITASFALHYKAIIDWIAVNNPDAEVILVGVLNSNAGMTVTGDGFEFDLGGTMDTVYGAISAYIAALPAAMQLAGEAEGVTFYFVDQPKNPEMISAVVGELAANNWQDDRIDGATVSYKTRTAYNEIVAPMVNDMVAGMELSSELLSKAHDCIYAALETAIVESLKSSEIDLNAVATFANGLESVFAGAPVEAFGLGSDGVIAAFTEFFCAEDMLPIVRLFAMNKVGNGISAHPTPATHDRIAESIISAYENEYTVQDKTVENLIYIITEYYDEAYAYAYQYADQKGYIDQAVDYIDEAILAVKAGKVAVADYAVEAEFAAVKAALLVEFDATVETLNKIKALLESDALATADGAYAEILALGDELDAHLNNLKTLADEIDFAVTPYVTALVDTTLYYAQLVETMANDAYAWMLENVAAFKNEYLAFVESVGKLADKIDPALGEAVRNFLIDTPADALSIIYIYGEEAVAKLFADAAAAAGDIYTVASNLVSVLKDYGVDIYNAVKNDPECIAILGKLDTIKDQLIDLKAQAEIAPIGVAKDIYAQIDVIEAEAIKLANEFYDAAMKAVAIANPIAAKALDDAFAALNEVLSIIGDYTGEYGDWFSDHISAMSGELLASIISNWNEFAGVAGPIVGELICDIINDIDDFIRDFIDDAYEYIDDLKDLIKDNPELKELYDALVELVDKLEELEDELYDHVAHIFAGEYEISVDSFYLAITEGDESYPDILAKALRLASSQYKKVTMDEVTAEDIAKADFITVGYGDFTSIEFTADQLLGVANTYVEEITAFVKAVDEKIDTKYPTLVDSFGIDIYETVMNLVEENAGKYLGMVEGKTIADLDWASVVGEENLSYVDEVRAEIVEAIVSAGIPETFVYSIDVVDMVGEFIADATENLATVNVAELSATLGEHAVFNLEVNVADLIAFAVESALYDFVSYNVEYSGLILNINEINPEALVAVLGNYNRLDVDYQVVIDEYTFTLADILALVDFSQIPGVTEIENVIADIAAIENYDINIPVAELVDCALEKYYDAVDYVVSFELPVCDEVKDLIAELVNTGNTYVEDFADKIAEPEVYIITLPFADLIDLVCEYGYPIVELINSSLNTEITVGGITIDADEALDVLANISSVHPFAYAVVFRNVFYVDISDARDGGDEYIADQIFNALTVSYKYLRGDVNGDGVVNDVDAIYLLRHTLAPDAYLLNQNGDMNGDGEVNDADAIYLLRYTMLPESYPLY